MKLKNFIILQWISVQRIICYENLSTFLSKSFVNILLNISTAFFILCITPKAKENGKNMFIDIAHAIQKKIHIIVASDYVFL